MLGMTDLPTRLREARQNAGFATATEAASRFGWKGPTYLGHENGSRGVTASAAKAYARAFRVSPEWLMFGGGSGETDAPARVDDDHPPAVGSALIPVYDVAASAGYGALVDTETIAYSMAFPPNYLHHVTSSNPRHLAIISVKGDSMSPTLKHDDIVMLDSSKTSLDYDGLFVLRYGEALHVKRVGRSGRRGHIMVMSDNRSEYPVVEYALEDVQAIGKVVWFGKKV